MTTALLLSAIAVVAFIAGFVVRGGNGGRRGDEPRQRKPAKAPQQSPTVEMQSRALIPLLTDVPAVEEPLRRGNKIAAIKEFREQTGCGLKEAKDAVETMEREISLGLR